MDRNSTLSTLYANLVVLIFLLAGVFMQNWILTQPKHADADANVVATGTVNVPTSR